MVLSVAKLLPEIYLAEEKYNVSFDEHRADVTIASFEYGHAYEETSFMYLYNFIKVLYSIHNK
jgi:hypothetical protein